MTSRGLYIDGVEVEGAAPEMHVNDPATGSVIATVAAAAPADVNRAVTVAHHRYEEGVWRRAPLRTKRDVLSRIAEPQGRTERF